MDSQPGMQLAISAASVICVQTRSCGAATMKLPSRRIAGSLSARPDASARHARHDHLGIDDPTFLDHDRSVQGDGAAAHRYVVMAAGLALAATLGIGPGREQEIAGEAARCGAAALRRIAIEGNGIPAALGVEPPAGM